MTVSKRDDKRTHPPSLSKIVPGTRGRVEFVVRPAEPDRIAFAAEVSTPRQNEEGVLEVCQRVVDHLNSLGANWSSATIPAGSEQGIDAVSHSHGHTLSLQVTRALADRDFWATLAEHKTVIAYTTRHQVADSLWRSIQSKTSIPPASRVSITLVLDASETFAHHSRDIIGVFHNKFGQRAKALGFKSIWIVGANREFVVQLA